MALNFHSYFSIFTKTDTAAATTNEFFPFDEDNHSSYDYTSTSSTDITYDPSDSKIYFAADGVYLVIFGAPLMVSAATGVQARIYINGIQKYISDPIGLNQNNDPRDATFHMMIEVKKGDNIQVSLQTNDSDTMLVQEGTSLVILKANGDYGSLRYSADADAAGAGPAEFTLFDSDNGGTVVTALKNVSFATATGLMTPTNTRKFLLLSTPILNVGTSGDITHKLYANGSSLDDLPGRVATGNLSPIDLSYGFLKDLTAAQTTSDRVIGAGTITVLRGSTFTIFDISNSGIDPSAYLALTVNGDSDALGSSAEIMCFDEDNWGTYASTVRSGAINGSTGITYTQADGKFTVGSTGKYFILWTVALGTVTDADATVRVRKNGTIHYTTPWYVDDARDPLEKTVFLVINADAEDYLQFSLQIASGGDGIFDAGTAITIFKVDDVNDLFVQESADKLISNDFTINNFSANTLGKQYDKINVKQVPFILGIPGPFSLRERNTAPVITLGSKKK